MGRFNHLVQAAPDAAFELIAAYKADLSPKKVDLSPGFYRDENAQPWILPSVRKAKEILHSDPTADHEHSPIVGHTLFLQQARDILFRGAPEVNDRIASVQTIAGTGANHLGAELAVKAGNPKAVWISNPSWINHEVIWQLADSNIEIRKYPYFDPETFTVNFEGVLSTLKAEAQEGDVIVLHACAHNPTGIDFTKEQWKAIAAICVDKSLVPLFDVAYQGFATGDLDEDAWAIRHFLNETPLEFMVAQSCSKNFGLYGERIGALHVVTESPDSKARVIGLLSKISRAELTTAPINGARIVATVLSDEALRKQWLHDLVEMSDRMKEMRQKLIDGLKSRQTPGSWDHILSDIGMFSMTGLTPDQVRTLRETHAVYMLPSGRISFTGLNNHNVDYVAESFHKIITQTS